MSKSIEIERERLAVLKSIDLFDTPPDPILSDYAAFIADIAKTPVGLVSLVDATRQLFVGSFGLDVRETPRSSSFCAHTIQRPEKVMWVRDALKDARFRTNPLVLGPPHIRFYAGAPILVGGQPIGSLCVIAPQPREFDNVLASQLHRFAGLLSERLEQRRRDRQLAHALEATSDAIITCDKLGTINGWENGAEELFGYSEVEALGASVSIIVPPDLRAQHETGMSQWRQGGGIRLNRRLDLTAVRKDGTPIEIELCMTLTNQAGDSLITSIIRDITDRRLQTKALESAKLEAEAANSAKSAFLAKMSHELRTPLNGVVGVLEMLAKSAASPTQLEFISIAQQSSRHLEKILADVLDLARIESGHISISEEPVALEEIVSAATDITALRASEKGLRISVEIDSSLPRKVVADPVRLKQILTNLLANAVKFTDDGSVDLKVLKAGTCCRFEIRDTGIGISIEEQALIFEPFRQADDTISRRFSGAGLGLAICRELVAAMGGSIGCTSAPGVGSLFWFEVALQAIGDDSAEERTAPPIVGDAPLSAVHILVADDNATNRRVVELMLGSMGADVTCVEDGAEAVNAFRTGNFDLVLMDMMMPVLNGLEATRMIREHEAAASFQPIPIIMVTANAMPEHIKDALAAGANKHLSKPITVTALLEAIVSVEYDGSTRRSDEGHAASMLG